MKKLISVIIILVVLAPAAASAHGLARMAGSTVTVDQALQQAVQKAVTPLEGVSYAITNISQHAGYRLVSVATLRSDVSEAWSFQDDAIGTGLYRAWQTTAGWQAVNASDMFKPVASNSSGNIFPWESGTAMFIGPAGAHNGWGSLPGWVAWDFVSGTAFSGTVAPDDLYASNDGTVDYVCRDGVSLAIKDQNFLYVHLMDDGTINEGYTLTRGQKIGDLKHGPFTHGTIDCGYADQLDTNYHVHWAFAQGLENIERWSVDTSDYVTPTTDIVWRSGAQTAGVGSWIYAEWPSDIIQPGGVDNFWDLILSGLETMATLAAAIFPLHQSLQLGVMIVTYATVPLEMFHTMMILNFGFAYTGVLICMFLWGLKVIIAGIKTIKLLRGG